MCKARLATTVAVLLSLLLGAPVAAQKPGKAPRRQAGLDRPAGIERPGRPARVYQDQAFSRGESDGYARGLEDGRKGERYDPVRHSAYRDGDGGYAASYGTRDGYKTNYRDGFRQGYEEGYRKGARAAR